MCFPCRSELQGESCTSRAEKASRQKIQQKQIWSDPSKRGAKKRSRTQSDVCMRVCVCVYVSVCMMSQHVVLQNIGAQVPSRPRLISAIIRAIYHHPSIVSMDLLLKAHPLIQSDTTAPCLVSVPNNRQSAHAVQGSQRARHHQLHVAWQLPFLCRQDGGAAPLVGPDKLRHIELEWGCCYHHHHPGGGQ